MNEIPQTYLRQARSFLAAGDSARAVELLERAIVLVRTDPRLLREVTDELSSAYDRVGRTNDAGRMRARLEKMAGGSAHDLGPALPPAPPQRSFPWVAAGAGAVLLIAAGILAYTYWPADNPAAAPPRGGSIAHAVPSEETSPDAGMPGMPAAAPGVLPAPTLAPVTSQNTLEQLLRENVAMLVVAAQYADQRESWLIPIATGTVFAVTSDGLMLTNRHVVDPEDVQQLPSTLDEFGKPTVTYRGLTLLVCFSQTDRVPAQVVYKSDKHDLAILKVQRRFARPMTLSYETPVQGEAAMACGFPGAVLDAMTEAELTPEKLNHHIAQSLATGNTDILNLLGGESFRSTLTRGIVSQSERNVNGSAYVQTDASVVPGNSGGPLLNSQNQVMGIVSSGIYVGAGNYNFALRLSQLRAELEQNGVR